MGEAEVGVVRRERMIDRQVVSIVVLCRTALMELNVRGSGKRLER